MTSLELKKIYVEHIQSIPPVQQLELIALISRELAERSGSLDGKQRSLLELEGKGADIWSGIDVQKYVNGLRDEWESLDDSH